MPRDTDSANSHTAHEGGHSGHEPMEPVADHHAAHEAASGEHTGHSAHGQNHTGHGTDFARRFWVCLALTVPVLLISPMPLMFFGLFPIANQI